MKYCNIVCCLAGILFAGCEFNRGENNTRPKPIVDQAEIERAEQMKKDLALGQWLYDGKSGEKTFEIFKTYADKSNAEAEAWLGRCYLNGIGTPVDYNRAFEYFSRAAAKNNPWGINGVGVCHFIGRGAALDQHKAMEYYKKAAEMNFPLSTLNLARTYSDSEGAFFDKKLAEEYFKKAIALKAEGAEDLYASFLCRSQRFDEAIPLLQKLNTPLAKFNLANCYANGLGVAVDIKKSLSFWEEIKHLPGNAEIAGRHFYTAGLEEFFVKGETDFAVNCFKNGAELGNRDCQYEYALLLKNRKQLNEAVKYMELAVKQGYDLAQLELGKMLMEKKDFSGAVKYLTSATVSDRTKRAAVEILVGIYNDLKDFKQAEHWSIYGQTLGIPSCWNNLATGKLFAGGAENISLAAAWSALTYIQDSEFGQKRFYEIIDKDYESLRAAADKGNGNALFALGVLGCLHEKNHPNVAIGLELMDKAVTQKNPYACRIMGNIYRLGSLVPRNLKKALEYYRKGIEINDHECALWVARMLYSEKELQNSSVDDYKKAFEKCIEFDELSMLYEYGRVMEFVAKDLKKAEELYRRAAQQGDCRAMVHLYDFLKEKDNDAAWNHLSKAVDLEYSPAELRIGDMEWKINDRRAAFELYMKSFMHGDSRDAAARLAECWLFGNGCDQNTGMFWKLSDIAYKNGSSLICLLLGDVYRDGKICYKDLKKAKEYYAEGVKRGNGNCRKALEAVK